MSEESIIEQLRNGGVGMLPTDTVYGLVCLPNQADAVRKVYHIKGRPASMNLPIFTDGEAMTKSLGLQVTAFARQLFQSQWMPGALTLILAVDSAAAAPWLQGRKEAAIRVPDDPRLLAILQETGPLLATSANEHGSKVDVRDFKAAYADLLEKPDFFLDAGRLSKVNSTIVNCTEAVPSVQREGAIPSADILKLITP